MHLSFSGYALAVVLLFTCCKGFRLPVQRNGLPKQVSKTSTVIRKFVAVPISPELLEDTRDYYTSSTLSSPYLEADVEEPEEKNTSVAALWKLQKKALLRIGGKGVKNSHINSLRELLDAHSVVKVKMNDYRSEIKVAAMELLGEGEDFGEILDIKGNHILFASREFMDELNQQESQGKGIDTER
mmetsp:Transcript_33767/g.49428  ORF Transcript_33767/g.49428 Transcript_33767/m.49428 type:complete len:185 (-) Transcript_33767:198-752(-)